MLKKIVISVVGAVASVAATIWAKRLLEKKPLKARVSEVKGKVYDLKSNVTAKVGETKVELKQKVQDLTDKVDSLIKEKHADAKDPE